MEFYKINRNGEEPTKLKEWFWKQVEASIRCSFMKYDIKLPEMVLVDELKSIHHTFIKIIRSNIDSLEEAVKWEDKKVFIEDELKLQAEANSFDDYIYEFRII